MEKVWVVIAAYNEERVIGEVVKGLVSASYRNVVVVDDGSKDKTSDISYAAGAHTVRHVINRGQGAALKTGIDYALHNGADVLITFDADGQHRVEDLPAMLAPIKNGTADVVLGSRFIKRGSNVPAHRGMALRGGALLFRALYGVKVTDSHNGLRAMTRNAAEKIEINADRMEHASEIVDQIGRKKLRYAEVPIVINYTDYSKAHTSQGMFPAIRILAKTLTHKFLR